MATLINRRQYLPIINGYVEVPDLDQDKSLTLTDALATISGSKVTRWTINKNQRKFELPTFERSDRFPDDWYAQLRAAAS